MKSIPVIIHKDKQDRIRPYVSARVKTKKARVPRLVWFLVDTGSPTTLLSEKDARLMQVSTKNLQKATPLNGVGGGIIDRYQLDAVELAFRTNNDESCSATTPMFVMKTTKRDKVHKDLSYSHPSILGMDFLDKTGWALYINTKQGEGELIAP